MSTTKELDGAVLEVESNSEETQVTPAVEVEVSTKTKESSKAKTKSVEKKMKAKSLDPNQLVAVYNGTHGRLVYVSKKTGEKFVWDTFGDSLDMELSELKSAKSSGKAFYTNNWFLFDDPEIVEYLAMGSYYKNAMTLQDLETFFEKTPEELGVIINGLSNGQKKTVAYRAKQLIDEGVIDSMKTVAALESALDTELIER